METVRHARGDYLTALEAWLACALAMALGIQMDLLVLESGLEISRVVREVLVDAATAVAALGCLLALGGGRMLRLERDDLAWAFRLGWAVMALGLMATFRDLLQCMLAGDAPSSEWPQKLELVASVALWAGLSEELVFRGLVLAGLLALMGGTRRGTIAAVVVSSLLFGLAHVRIVSDFAEPMLALQAMLKIVHMGIFALVLCVFVIRTHHILGAVLLHVLYDFVLYIPTALFDDVVVATYVDAGEAGMVNVMVYAVGILLYLPALAVALRMLAHEDLAWRGTLADHAAAMRPARHHRRRSAPVPPQMPAPVHPVDTPPQRPARQELLPPNRPTGAPPLPFV
jgi:membrane protease YdiL (CAAX protease family)